VPQVQILSRSPSSGLPGEGASVDTVVVVYSSALRPPRSLIFPRDSYRPATGAELAANPRLRFYPKDQANQDGELKAIGEDLHSVLQADRSTFEVP
jgi:hypothetical protein